jgi:hypothetical protein
MMQSTLTANPDVTDADPNIQLLRTFITAIRSASPDDTHMAIRYGQFLEILLNASTRLSSSGGGSPPATGPGTTESGAEQQPDPGGDGGFVTEDIDWWSRYAMMAAGTGPDTTATLNLNLNLPVRLGPQMGRDPFQWWDGALGTTSVGFSYGG